jgi:hypothetical protein
MTAMLRTKQAHPHYEFHARAFTLSDTEHSYKDTTQTDIITEQTPRNSPFWEAGSRSVGQGIVRLL